VKIQGKVKARNKSVEERKKRQRRKTWNFFSTPTFLNKLPLIELMRGIQHCKEFMSFWWFWCKVPHALLMNFVMMHTCMHACMHVWYISEKIEYDLSMCVLKSVNFVLTLIRKTPFEYRLSFNWPYISCYCFDKWYHLLKKSLRLWSSARIQFQHERERERERERMTYLNVLNYIYIVADLRKIIVSLMWMLYNVWITYIVADLRQIIVSLMWMLYGEFSV